jgi:serine/threonine protein kinase
MGYRVGVADTYLVLSRLAFVRASFEVARTLAGEALEIAADLGHAGIVESARSVQRLAQKPLLDAIRKRTPRPEPDVDIPAAIDRYKVTELLGVGALCAVYLAHDPDSGRRVAVKVVKKETLREHPGSRPLLRREAEMLSSLQHPALLRCYGYGETADLVYNVLEFLEGRILVEVLEEQEGFLPGRRVIGWAVQICDALAHIHNLRPVPIICHEIKPTTVGVEPNGRVRLITFWAAEPYQAGQERASTLFSPGYASPEQWMGYSDARSDVYALGATLHHLLTRRDPYKERLFSFHDAPPRSLNPAVSEELEAAVLKAVEHNPENRYQSAAELKAALLACLR